MARGQAAREILSATSFNEAYQLLLSDRVDDLLSTPASDFDTKKRLSFEIEGLQSIIRRMSQFVEQGEQLQKSLGDSALNEARGE